MSLKRNRGSSTHGRSQKLPVLEKKSLDSQLFNLSSKKHNATFKMSALDCNNEETDEELKSWQDWIGHRVSISGVKFGILRYFGKTHFAEGSWCGVELDEPVGKNNGTVKDVRYFTCKENFGIFAPLSKIEKIPDSAGTSGGISIASKSKLPHPKSKLKFIPQPKALPRTCETTFREPAKSHLPYFSSNVNDLKTNAVNEVYSKQHRFSDSFLENKKCESNENYFNSNNNKNSSFFDMGHLKIAERNTSTPVDNLFRKYSEKRTVDLLNQTVILNDNKKTSYPQQNISLGILPGDFMLNTTFDVFGIQSLGNEPVDKGSTFVVGNVFPDELSKKSLEGRISSEEDLISAELEESLGILSPSQMKDFTLSFDNSGNAVQKSPKIRKIESCDDVNELPEFEDNRMYEGLMPDESLDTITEPCSERHWKDRIVCHSTQIVCPKEQSSQKKSRSNVGFQEDSDDKSVEYCLTKTPAQKLLPRELEHLKYDFDLSDFHPLEDINFNVPSATSTPTFLSKPPRVAVSKRHLNSDLHSLEVDQIIPSTVLNQTYSHPGTNEYPSTPKINVISKLLSDLDPIQIEPFQTVFSCSQKDVVPWEKSNDFPKSEETHTFESSGSTFEIPVIGECLPNNLNQEATSAILESALELNISSVEKKHSTSSVKFLANNQPLYFSPVNDVGAFKLQDGMNSFHSDMTNSLEENNKVICVQQEYVDGSMESLSVNHSEKSSCDANKTIVIIPSSDIESDSHKNEDNGEMKILCGKKVEESNFLDAFCYQNTVSKSMTLSFHDHKLDKDSITEIVDDENQSTKSGGSSVIQNVIRNCNDEDNKINVIPSENMKSNNNIELMKTQVIETSDIASSETEAIIEKNEIAIKDILNETTVLNSTSSNKINLCIQDDIGNKVIPDTSKEITLKNHIIPQADIEKCIFDDVTTEPRKLESPVFSISSSVISKETENEYENKTNSLDATRVIHAVECKENSYSDNFNVTVNVTSTDVKSVKKSNTSCDKNVAKSVSGPKNVKNNVGKPVNSKKSDEAKNISVKLPKKNVVSKIKMMLESSKINSASNQENVNSKPHATNSKKVGKWDTVTSRIAASLADNKKKLKKEVTSRVNTNLNASRQLTPKTSPRPSIAKCTKRTENKKSQLLNETTVSTNLKNTLNSQKGCDDLKSVCSTEENAERDIRILSQLQNVSDCNKPAIGLKETSVNLKKKKLGLSKAPDRASQSDSASSFGSQVSLASSKIATLQQKSSNPLRIVPNRSQKANITSLSNASIGIKEKEQPAKNVSTIRNKTTQLSVGSKVQTTRSSSKVTEVKSVNSRWSSRQAPSKINAEPRKFISKTELVKEIQELGVLCESRTKELNMLKIQHRHAVLGFEALAVLNKHMVQQYDPFSQPQLVKNYKKAKDELKKAAELLQLYQVQLEELKSIHGNELLKLTTKLEEAYSGEIKELKTNHAIQLKEMDSHHKEQVKKLKESFKNESAEREQNHCEQFKELQESYQKQKIELEKSHAQKLDEIDFNHQEIQNELQNNIKILHHQYETLQKQLQEMEEAFKRDKNAKIQYISAKKTELEKEVDSLKAVLEIKSSQIQGLHSENIKMKKELEELPIAKEKIKNLENKTEDLKAMMQEKMRMQRELSNENQQLAENCEKESRVNIHLSMVNEELQWRLQQSKESTLRSASLSASPVLWSSEYHSSEGNRSDSRMSLPILQSEKFGILSDSLKHNPSKLETETNIKCHSMSLSWHPVLPTHVETVTSKTSSFAKSSELQIDKNTKSNFSGVSKLSSKKLLKEDDEFLKRRSQLTTNQMLVNHPMSMSWGGESFADYYEDLDDSYFKDLSSEDSKSKFLRRMPSKQEIIKQKEVWMKARSANHSPTTSNNQNKLDLDQDVDKSLSGIISLQSSYTSDSSCSYVPTQPGSEESSSCSNKSQDNDSKNNSDLMVGHDTDPFGRKYPRNLAGEAMIQDIDSIAPISHQTKTNNKDRFDQVDEISSSSPEESKEKFINPVSMTTPSIDTLSSQGMADSTNLDVSWGDEEMLSENDS